MIKAENILSAFLGKILDDKFFADIQITRAFPGVIKPTLLKNAVIAVGLKSLEADESSLGDNVKTGSFSIFTDIYVPFSDDLTTAEKIIFRICKNTAAFNISAVSISEMSADSLAECYVMRAVFTFNSELDFRGEYDG